MIVPLIYQFRDIQTWAFGGEEPPSLVAWTPLIAQNCHGCVLITRLSHMIPPPDHVIRKFGHVIRKSHLRQFAYGFEFPRQPLTEGVHEGCKTCAHSGAIVSITTWTMPRGIFLFAHQYLQGCSAGLITVAFIGVLEFYRWPIAMLRLRFSLSTSVFKILL